MAQTVKNYEIEALSCNNYHNWKFRMDIILAQNGVTEMMEKEIDPSTFVTENEKQHFNKNDCKGTSLIVQYADDN